MTHTTDTEKLTIEVASDGRVSALLYPAAETAPLGATLVLAHGAGADQQSEFMVTFARGLAARGFDVLTFNFPYMEAKRRLPDPADRLEACYRAVVATARTHPRLGANALIVGGKSLGGRIASLVAARTDDPATLGLVGVVILGYPLHPPGKPDQLRVAHLPRIRVPILFLQGTRDSFGTPPEIRKALTRLGVSATIYAVLGGDHSFAIAAGGALTQESVYTAVQEEIVRWAREVLQHSGAALPRVEGGER
jgi:predicted alpha/beta-hydrolase family hydrolase